MKQLYYINYSWVGVKYPSEDYGTYTGIIATNDIQAWWIVKCSDENYCWVLNGVNRV